MSRRSFLVAASAGVAGFGILKSRSFSNGNLDRNAGIPLSSDPNGVLGLQSIDTAENPAVLTNNYDGPMEVTLDSSDTSASFDVGNDGNFVDPPVTFSLAGSQSEQVAVQGYSQTVPVDIVTTFENSTIRMDRNFVASQAGQIEVTASVKSAGNSGKYEFGLQNTGSIDATIEKIAVLETSVPAAVKVGGHPSDSILVHTGQSLVSSEIPVDSSNPSSGTLRQLSPTVTLSAGGTEQVFEFDRFRDERNKNAQMKDAEVEIQLEFGDGSRKALKLCPTGSCSEI